VNDTSSFKVSRNNLTSIQKNDPRKASPIWNKHHHLNYHGSIRDDTPNKEYMMKAIARQEHLDDYYRRNVATSEEQREQSKLSFCKVSPPKMSPPSLEWMRDSQSSAQMNSLKAQMKKLR